MAISRRLAGRSTRRAVSSMIWFRSANFFSGGFSRAKSSSRRMMLAQRLVSRITRSMSSASWLPSAIFSRSSMREGQHAGQRIVQLVRDAGGQQADRRQFFAARGFGLGDAKLLGSLLDLLLQRARPLLQLRAGIPQRRGHGIEGFRQLAELVVAAHRDRLFQIARGDPPRAGFQVAQRQIDQTAARTARPRARRGAQIPGKRR